MKDIDKTKEQLIEELVATRQRLGELEAQNFLCNLTDEKLNFLIEERTAALKESNDNLVVEVVERRQVENALRSAKDQLQTVLEAVPGMVSWINSDLHYIEVNQELANIFNLPREEFAGKNIGFLGTSSEFYELVRDFFASSETEISRQIISKIGNELRNYLIVAQKYDGGRAAFVIGIDITDRVQAEKQLRTAKDQLQTVLQSVPGTVSWISSDLRYIEVNQQLADIFNLPREEFADKDIGFLGTSSEFYEFVRNFFASPEKETSREISSKVGEEVRHYLIVAQKYDSDRATFVVGIDITSRKEAENSLRSATDQLHTVLQAVPGMVSWISSDLNYIEVNQELADIFNLPREQFAGKDIGFLGTSSEFYEFVSNFFATPETETSREISSIVRGKYRHYLIVAQKYDSGRAAFVVGIDITQRKLAEESLRATSEKLEAVLEAVPGIVSWISSDLHYLGVNRHLAQTYNLPREAFIGQKIGFLHSSDEFTNFMSQLFANPDIDAYQEISAYVNGTQHNYLIVAQKYAGGEAAFAVGIDITARQRAEEGLRQAEEKYRTLFENAVEGIFQTAPDGRFLSANPALARIYGYHSPQELVGSLTNIRRQLYVLPKRREEFVRLLEEGGGAVGFESQIYRKNGSIIWISENARVVRDDNGNTIRYEGTVEDITERKEAQEGLQRANELLEGRVEERTAALKDSNHKLVREIAQRQHIENALRKSEAELRALFAAMTDVITVFDAQGKYVKIVSTNSEVLYSPTEELLGNSVYEVLPPNQANLFMINIQRALNTGQPVNIEYSLLVGNGTENSKTRQRPWGMACSISENDSSSYPHSPLPEAKEVWFSATISPLPDNCVIWVARNVTERKRVLDALQRAEEKYRSIFENTAEGIFQTTPDGHFLSANPALVQMCGYSDAEELIAKMTDIAKQLYVKPNRRAEFIAALEEYGSISDFESHVYRADGNVIWISENARVVRDRKDRVLYYEGTVQDITHRKLVEEALKLEREKSERLLLNILPKKIAEQLKQCQNPIAERFERVTILFADIVQFTNLSSRISPTELVNLLNEIFSVFDQLSERHHLEKIKTIGDSYMVAAGLNNDNDDRAEAIARMALDMQQAITQFSNDLGEPFQIRIGINTGPVVAGVIGIKKFIYDMWGDTVNVASRMESQGIPGKIQITQETYKLLKDKFLLLERGTISVKGKGDMTTYWLAGTKTSHVLTPSAG
ncbi:MAG: PAS domain S-box protein [Cyanobacteriota bacterium]|nr:PAS domain S-box protein [Cyanobacteriota bacterium]